MEKICLDRIADVGHLLEFNMHSEAAEKLQALHTCAERSDCRYWLACAQRAEDLWNRQTYATKPESRTPA